MKHTGLMVGLFVPKESASALSAHNHDDPKNNHSLDPADMHVTLGYLGDLEKMDNADDVVQKTHAIVSKIAASQTPVVANITGLGRFPASESSDGKDVIHAKVEKKSVLDLHNQIEQGLGQQGIAVSKTHDFTPHITLAYIDKDGKSPISSVPAMSIPFNGITVASGDTRKEYPFKKEAANFVDYNKEDFVVTYYLLTL